MALFIRGVAHLCNWLVDGIEAHALSLGRVCSGNVVRHLGHRDEAGGMAAGYSAIDPPKQHPTSRSWVSYQLLFLSIGIVATLFSFLLYAFVKSLAKISTR